MSHLDILTSSVIRVGDGRGFVVEGDTDRLIITAAHCLPFLPPCCAASSLHECSYQQLLAPIGGLGRMPLRRPYQ
jgi:hypothetical protein